MTLCRFSKQTDKQKGKEGESKVKARLMLRTFLLDFAISYRVKEGEFVGHSIVFGPHLFRVFEGGAHCFRGEFLRGTINVHPVEEQVHDFDAHKHRCGVVENHLGKWRRHEVAEVINLRELISCTYVDGIGDQR